VVVTHSSRRDNWKDRGRDGARRHPSLQTGRADFPHPAFQSVGALARGSGSSPRPQGWPPDLRYTPSHRSPTSSNRWLALAGTLAGLSSGIPSVILPPSCVPSLHGHYPLHGDYERSDSRQPDGWTMGPPHLPALTGLPDYCQRTSDHSVSNHLRVVQGSPRCQWVLPTVTGFVFS
jgi:hypothetical protein